PGRVPVAISAHHRDRRSNRAQIIGNRWLADITEMPDFIRTSGQIENLLRQFIMRICDHENPKHRRSKESKNAGRERPFSNLFSWVPPFLGDNWRGSCEVLNLNRVV